MATAKGIAKMSKIFDQAYEKPIDEEAYSLWLELFEDVDDEDLRKAAIWLAKTRAQYMRGLVTPDEITRELQDMGIYPQRRQEDPAFAAAMAQQFPVAEGEGITLAEFCKMYPEVGQALKSYMRGGKRETVGSTSN